MTAANQTSHGEQLDLDLACAVALGMVEHPRMAVNLDSITLHDSMMRSVAFRSNWLIGGTPLHDATRDYLLGKRDAMLASASGQRSSWGAASAIRKRDMANQQANQARSLARAILEDKGVLVRAKAAGLRVVES